MIPDDAPMAAFALEDAVPVHEKGGQAGAVPASPIGIGKPMSIRIRSIFPGERAAGGAVLVTSAARSPIASKAAPLAMHYYFEEAVQGQTLRARAKEPGSDVVLYSPGLIESTVQVDMQLSFDRFDLNLYNGWVDAARKAVDLPVFALGLRSGGIGALVYAVEQAVRIVLRAIDRHMDQGNDWTSTWDMPVQEAGRPPAASGYWLFYGDGGEGTPTVPGPNSPLFKGEYLPVTEQYCVDVRDATLRYNSKPQKQVLEGEPYVLVYVNGAASDELSAWSRASVSATLAERFLDETNNGDDASDLVGMLEVYNDAVMSRRVKDIDERLQIGDLQGIDLEQLKAKRRGYLEHIIDRDLAKQLRTLGSAGSSILPAGTGTGTADT